MGDRLDRRDELGDPVDWDGGLGKADQQQAAGAWVMGVPVPSAPLLAGMPLFFQVGYGTSTAKLAASQALEWRP